MEGTAEEARKLVKLSCHPNIVKVFGLYSSKNDFFGTRNGYVMEFMSHGNLSQGLYPLNLSHTFSVIHNPSISYDRLQIYSWIIQASRGISYLHKNNFIHRNVNPRK